MLHLNRSKMVVQLYKGREAYKLVYYLDHQVFNQSMVHHNHRHLNKLKNIQILVENLLHACQYILEELYLSILILSDCNSISISQE